MSDPGTDDESEEPNQDTDGFVSNLLEAIDSGAVMTKYVIIIEGIDTDGDRAIYTSTNDEASSWDVLGMVDYVHMKEQAQIFHQSKDE